MLPFNLPWFLISHFSPPKTVAFMFMRFTHFPECINPCGSQGGVGTDWRSVPAAPPPPPPSCTPKHTHRIHLVERGRLMAPIFGILDTASFILNLSLALHQASSDWLLLNACLTSNYVRNYNILANGLWLFNKDVHFYFLHDVGECQIRWRNHNLSVRAFICTQTWKSKYHLWWILKIHISQHINKANISFRD